ncbi:hypothetical protein ACHAWF_015135, partial [Thalassiosira exigua]
HSQQPGTGDLGRSGPSLSGVRLSRRRSARAATSTFHLRATVIMTADSDSKSNPSSPSPLSEDPAKWERISSQVLAAVRCFVDGLRSAPQPLHTVIHGSKPEKERSHMDGGASLWAHLRSCGVTQQVQELQQRLGELPCIEPGPLTSDMSDVSLGSLLQSQSKVDERQQSLYQIILPLMRNLEQCYDILDNLPQANQPSTKETPPIRPPHAKAKQKSKAPPPPGMLSLNDYTNVACMLEFAVSISLVPILERPQTYLFPLTEPLDNNIFTDSQLQKVGSTTTFVAHKRSQFLPKALAGRLPKILLTWGTSCAAKTHNLLCDKLRDFSTHLNHVERSSRCQKDSNRLHQKYYIYHTYQSYNEITSIATSLGYILLLDRFRPMLLPRHLSDVYLALLIAERLRWYLSQADEHIPHEMGGDLWSKLMEEEKSAEQTKSRRLHSVQKALLLSPLTFPSSLISEANAPLHPLPPVHCRDAALAYRGLLGGATSMMALGAIPPWLRLRLGQCMTKLAQDDLQSVVEVFVAYAHGPGGGKQDCSTSKNDDIMTGAAARLAQALCAKPTSVSNSQPSRKGSCTSHDRLLSQLVDFLVGEGGALMEELRKGASNTLARSRPSMAMHLTLWATIAQLPLEILRSSFIVKLSSGLMPLKDSKSKSLTAMQSAGAIAAWLFTVPSSLDPLTKEKIQSLLMLPLFDHNSLTLFGQVLRLAASFSHNKSKSPSSTLIAEVNIHEESNQKIYAKLVRMCLAQIIHILATIDHFETSRDWKLSGKTSLELLKAVSEDDFDRKGYKFQSHDSEYKAYKRLAATAYVTDLPHEINEIQDRADCLVRAITSSPTLIGDEHDLKTDDSPGLPLACNLFRLTLFFHYSILSENQEDFSERHNNLADIESSVGVQFEALSHRNSAEMKLAATVLLALLCERCPPSSLIGSLTEEESDVGVLNLLGLVINSAAGRAGAIESMNTMDEDADALFSTASIVLSLLIAVLEMGQKRRSESEESFFKLLLPSLHILSNAVMVPELAEMASHAMALIAARGEPLIVVDDDEKSEIKSKKSRLEDITGKISEAESALQSSQPPLRAKGIVMLRHVARYLLDGEGFNSSRKIRFANDPPDEQQAKGALVMEMNPVPSESKILSAQEMIALVSRSLAKICLNALADSESYVYLASIQTLVVLGDLCPSDIMSLMVSVLAKGQMNIEVLLPDTTMATTELSLNPEQRIKAAEALIFMIRRRGDAIFMHGPSLLDAMISGPSKNDVGDQPSRLCDEGTTSLLIQNQTHSYFMGSAREAEEGMPGSNDEQDLGEKKIRLNTGGPVFTTEENDLLHSGAISIVCELVSVLDPAIISQYCPILVRLVTNALQLDTSRPVRRAAANLARELYDSTLREVTAENGSSEDIASTMAIAIVRAKEENLYHVLSRCVFANEIPTGGKSRLVDPATQARCSEALAIRLNLDSLGVLKAAATVAHSLEQEMKDSTVQAIRKALS